MKNPSKKCTLSFKPAVPTQRFRWHNGAFRPSVFRAPEFFRWH